MENITYYIVALLMVVVGVLIIKKVAGCMIRAVVTLVLLAALAALYLNYFR